MKLAQTLKYRLSTHASTRAAYELGISALRKARGMSQGLLPTPVNAPGLGRIIDGKVRVAVPEFMGEFELSARSHLLYRLVREDSFEPEACAALRERLDPGLDALDVGANIGFYSVLLAKLLHCEARVLAVEPTPGALAFLHANLRHNGVAGKVLVYEGAAAEQAGRLCIQVVAGREEYSSAQLVHGSVSGEDKLELQVPGTRLDALVAEHRLRPGFMKLDIEGAELAALRGAEETLSSYGPDLLMEFLPELLERQGSSAQAIESLLKRHNYSLQFVSPGEVWAHRRKSHGGSSLY